MKGLMANGTVVPEDIVGRLTESIELLTDPPALRRRLQEEGYLFLRGALDGGEVMGAREEVFQRMVEVGEIKPPAIAGIPTGTSRRQELVGNLGPFWKSVSEGPRLRQVTHGVRLNHVLDEVFGEPTVAHDFMWLRSVATSRSYGLHFDAPYFTRFSDRVCTVWVPLGDIPSDHGALVVVEGSNRYSDLIAELNGSAFRKEPPMIDTVCFARQRSARLLTTHFRPGDIVVFGMYTMHGSLDNCSPEGRVRLSCDVRYQPAAEPREPCYFGPNPTGYGGTGYGALGANFSLGGEKT